MIKLRKKMLFGVSAITIVITPIILASCGGNSSNSRTLALVESMEKDPLVSKLKTDLEGYSKESLEIVGSKSEIVDETKDLVQAFNQYFGTNIVFTQSGQAIDPQVYIGTKFANGVGKTLLVANSKLSLFKTWEKHFIDTSASKMLKGEENNSDDYIVNGKRFMPQLLESAGIIYNKDVFKKIKVTVFEGKSFDQATSKPESLTKGQSYNGVIEHNSELYVFTDDLKKEGFAKLNSFLESKGYKPFYPTSKATSSNVWTITNHLLGAATWADNKNTIEEIKSNSKNIVTSELMESMKTALEIEGHDKPYNIKTNTVQFAMAAVASGTEYVMVQNGTWSTPLLTKANQNVNVGFLPYPIFSKEDQTAVLMRGATQRWALTTLGNDESKLKTAKLFLQFLYQTKAGLEYAKNSMTFASPFKLPEGANGDTKDQLINSSNNYDEKDVSGTWPNLFFPSGFNNSNSVLAGVVNNNFAMADKENLFNEYQKQLENDKKKT